MPLPGLVNLAFLAALAAVAVPLALHLLLRPRARRVDIGSLRFLRVALKDSTRFRRLRRWLLLALRCLALVLLALLFARPFLAGTGPGNERLLVVVLDRSASMAAQPGGGVLFTRALAEADRLIAAAPPGTAVEVAYADAAGVAPAPEPRIDRSREPGHAGTDHAAALAWARDRVLASSRKERRVVYVTDRQRSGLPASPPEPFPEGVAVEVLDAGRLPAANLAVIAADATQTALRPGEPVVVAARVANESPFPARNVRVRLLLDGPEKVDETATLSIPGGAAEGVLFTPALTRPGLYQGRVEVAAEDEFPADDRRYLAFEARPPDRILLVDGEPGRSPFAHETYYLEAALRLRLPSEGSAVTPYEPERFAWDDAARLPDLAPFRVVALCNVAALSAPDAGRLREFVSRGGGLLIFPGSRTSAAGLAPLAQVGLLPASPGEPAEPDLYRFDTWTREHPVFEPLSDPQQGDLRRVAFRRIVPLAPAEGAVVLARAQTGAPLLVEGSLGEGHVLLAAFPADRDWSDWPQGRLYVPLVHQLAGYLTGRLPGTSRVRTAPAGPAAPPGVVPEGKAVLVRNLDPRESEMEAASADEFRAALSLPDAAGDSTRPFIDVPAGAARAGELWPWVLALLLLALVAEWALANRSPSTRPVSSS